MVYIIRQLTTSCFMQNTEVIISDSTETGSLGVMHLKRYWDKAMIKKSGSLSLNALNNEWNIDITLLSVLGLGLEQTIKKLFAFTENFNAFENWILDINNGKLEQVKIDEFNTYILNRKTANYKINPLECVLSKADWNSWNENGYFILRNAVPAEDCEAAISTICDFIEIKRDDPGTWYINNPERQGIMVQLFQHPTLEKNRRAPKIRAAFEELWGRKDIWVNTDRAGFNPPETGNYKFLGPDLHWDVSLELPIPFGTQGILYLADTAFNQGAFTLVPGFQNRIADWLQSLPAGTDPRTQNIHALGSIPIVANAGDLIIWHHALPHGSSPNTASIPRFVQYLNYAPLDAEVNDNWI